MFNKIKAVKDLRQQAKKMQNALAEIMEIGEALGGDVRIAIDGNQTVQRIEISESALANKTRLEAGLKDAFNQAVKKIQKQMAAKMKDMGGLSALKDLGL